MNLSTPSNPALPPRAELSTLGPVRRWIVDHDDSWLFTIAYLGLALLLSIWISLFWLVVLVAIHFVLEWIRHREFAFRGAPLARLALWAVKLDVALVLFALALTAYLDVLLGMAGLGSAARVGARAAARMGGWSRAIKATLLSLDDLAQVARVAIAKRSGSARVAPDVDQAGTSDDAQAGAAAEITDPLQWKSWSRGDALVIGFGLLCLLAILIAPWTTPHTSASLVESLLADLHPYPKR